MLSALVDLSIKHRGVVIALACLLLGYGLFVTAHAKLDIYPEFAPPRVEIQTEAPGLSPEQVETLVTRPIEAAVNGVGGLDSLRSESIQGLSVITAIFKDEVDIFRARQVVAERLVEAANQLPQGVQAPVMAPLTSSTSDLLLVGLVSDARSPMDLRSFARWTVRPRLLGVPGVAKVSIFGGEERQLQVQVRPERLAAFGLALEDVVQAAKKATGVRGAGFIETESQRVVIRTEGQTLTPEALGDVVVAARDGASPRLRDVARVIEAARPRFGDAAAMGRRGVLIQVSGQYGENTTEVTEAIERALADLGPALAAEKITLVPALFRPASFVDAAIGNVKHSLILGGVLVGGVLFLFLFNVRTAFISLTAIPLSLLIAVVVLTRLGLTLNTLTLGGLAIAIGEVVDDAIIDVENIFRRLRESGEGGGGAPRSVLRIVYDASLEVRGSVVYATLVVVLVFVPVLTMSGIQGKLFAPLGLAYVLAILASLVVAITLTPALAAVLLAGRTQGAAEPPLVARLKARYERLLEALSGHPKTLIACAAILCAGAAVTLKFFGGEFLPEFQEHHFTLHMSLVPGTSTSESMRIGTSLAKELLKNPHIRTVSQFAGRAEQGDDTWGPHYSELELMLDPSLDGDESDAVVGEIRNVLMKYPGASFKMNTFITERMEEVLTGSTADVVVKIFGDDLDALDSGAHAVAAALEKVPGHDEIQIPPSAGQPELVVRLDPARLLALGFAPTDVLDAVETAYEGDTVAQTYLGSRVVDVSVILEPDARRAPEAVGDLLLRNAGGRRVPLRELAEITLGPGRYSIVHDTARRQQSVTCNVRGRDVASFVADAKRAVKALELPKGTYATFAGTAEAQATAQREILLHSSIAGVGILLLLSIVFKNLSNLVLVLANLPFALVGGVLAVFVSGGSISVGSLVGFVTLFGITTRNSIMMISHYEHLVGEEGHEWNAATAIRGASERLAPVLMTAIVTALGLLPIAIGSGDPGREIEGPMAIVILGGLATSTVLNLLVLPTLALRFGRFERRAAGEPALERSA
jgi:CzcA family heavy metal efflux pump